MAETDARPRAAPPELWRSRRWRAGPSYALPGQATPAPGLGAKSSGSELNGVRSRGTRLSGFWPSALPTALRLQECSLHKNDGHRWIALPSRPQIDAEGDTAGIRPAKSSMSRSSKFPTKPPESASRRRSPPSTSCCSARGVSYDGSSSLNTGAAAGCWSQSQPEGRGQSFRAGRHGFSPPATSRTAATSG